MLHFMPDIWRSDVVVEAFRVVLDDYLALALAFILPFDKLLLNVIVPKRLHKGTEFLLLVVSSRAARIHEDRGTDHSG